MSGYYYDSSYGQYDDGYVDQQVASLPSKYRRSISAKPDSRGRHHHHRSSSVRPQSRARDYHDAGRWDSEDPREAEARSTRPRSRRDSEREWEEQDRERRRIQRQWEQEHAEGEARRRAMELRRAMEEQKAAEEEMWERSQPTFFRNVEREPGVFRRVVIRHVEPGDLNDHSPWEHLIHPGGHAGPSHNHHHHDDRRARDERARKREQEDRGRRRRRN